MAGLPISAIGGITTWRDAAEFIALGAGTVQVCTAAMTYGFKVVQEMITGLADYMDAKGYATIEDFRGRAIPSITDWQYLNLNYVAKAEIDQDLCIRCGRCHIVCEDTSHQAIFRASTGSGNSWSTKPNASAATYACWSARSRAASRSSISRGRRSAHRPRLRAAAGELDDAPEQPQRREGGGVNAFVPRLPDRVPRAPGL